MTNLSVGMREELAAKWRIGAMIKTEKRESEDGAAKYLFTLEDGHKTEAVYMPYDDHTTICLSSMVGCPVGCTFCATGNLGYSRNLTAGEIIDQIYAICAEQKIEPKSVRNLVFMGMGEPLLNYNNVVQTIHTLIDESTLDLSPRRITVSTVGIPEGIRKLAREDIGVKLALSLHAPDDETRKQIIPLAHHFSIQQIMDAIREYYDMTKRRITFEYTMLAGINDHDWQAKDLIKYSRGITAHFNLIPYNAWESVTDNPNAITGSSKETIEKFAEIIKDAGIDTTIRWSRGDDAAAACGQLALKGEQ